MRNLIFSVVAAAAVLAAGAPAAVANEASDRSAAIELCRNEVAARAGVDVADVRLDAVRARARVVRVDVDLWKDGALTNVRCEVSRGAAPAIVALNPPLNAAQASAE